VTQPGISAPPTSVVVGISGAQQNAAVAVAVDGRLESFCELERVTRIRRARLTPGALPDEALDAALSCTRVADRGDVGRFVVAEADVTLPPALPIRHLEHHEAHAATAYYLSPFERAAVFVCDRHAPVGMSAWSATPIGLSPQAWLHPGPSLASLYSRCAELFGLPPGNDHQLEALARLDGAQATLEFGDLIGYADGRLTVAPEWTSVVASRLSHAGSTLKQRATIAGSFQRHLGTVLLSLLADLRAHTDSRCLALGGGLFYNTFLTTLVRQSGLFDDVFVPPNPGNAGIAAGAALAAAPSIGRRDKDAVSPFLGPEYDPESIKRTLDNCKLSYDVVDERHLIESTVGALIRGELVAWFQGRMEWGHRALGGRSILASPLSPYVLENLNVFLKHRERHRTYGVSVPVERAAEFFDGPPASRYMEFEYAPLSPDRFRTLLPEGASTLRVQTIPLAADRGSSHLFRVLHQRFGDATGVPVLVNTSFNGFLEPMVCSPRDAVRVFFGSGLDRLVIGRFVIRK
jgi:carbamoyltransferase